MKLEEAIKKYSIIVPSDEIFYSDEYREYFNGGKKKDTNEEMEQYRAFDQMFKKSFIVTFSGGEEEIAKNRQKRAFVLGGQTGAGKSGLVNMIFQEAKKNSQGIFLIDDDQFRKFYPRYEEIMAECPEFSTILTAKGSGPVTPKVMKYASDNGLNFIFDGTMKNPRILDTASKWKDYNVSYKIMATSRIESLISIFERNAYLRQNGFGRPISVEAHDETYNGIEGTIKKLEQEQPDADIEIYIRGNNSDRIPRLIYSPKQKGMYRNAAEALLQGRERDRKRVLLTDIDERIANLEAAERVLNSVEKAELLSLKESLREEIR